VAAELKGAADNDDKPLVRWCGNSPERGKGEPRAVEPSDDTARPPTAVHDAMPMGGARASADTPTNEDVARVCDGSAAAWPLVARVAAMGPMHNPFAKTPCGFPAILLHPLCTPPPPPPPPPIAGVAPTRVEADRSAMPEVVANVVLRRLPNIVAADVWMRANCASYKAGRSSAESHRGH
jgi:hypothetical protein